MSRGVCLIAITGGSGSGKSWLARRLTAALGDVAESLSLDHFYRDLSDLPCGQRHLVNFDHPDAIDWPLFRRVLVSIRRGQSTAVPQYDFNTHTRQAQTLALKPGRLVIVEGLWLLRRAELRRLYSLSVFIDCPEALRLERRMDRDQRERGRSSESVRAQFERQVLPMHRRFVASQTRHADLVVMANGIGAALTELDRRCREFLSHPL